jgi:hypothetical protein
MTYIVHSNLFRVLLYALKCHIRLTKRLPYCSKDHFIYKFLETSENLTTRLLFGRVSYPYVVENYWVRSEHFHSICNVFVTTHTKSYFEKFEVRENLAGPSIVLERYSEKCSSGLGYAHFCDFMQCTLVVSYIRFGTTYSFYFHW